MRAENHHGYLIYFFLLISMIASFMQQKLEIGVYGVIVGTIIAGIVK
jgi:ABC-type lipoprotein release transport system permease subunit